MPGEHTRSFLAAREPEDVHGLPFDAVCFAMNHNAYASPLAPPTAQTFDEYWQCQYVAGSRGLELDMVKDPAGWNWSVGEWTADYEQTPYRQVALYLRTLWSWSVKHEGHDPILLFLEPKDDLGPDFALQFDGYVRDNLDPSRLFTPAQLLNGRHTLQDAVAGSHWPTVQSLRSRFVVVLTGGDEPGLSRYAATDAATRIAFSDRGISAAPGDPMQFQDSNRLIVDIETVGTVWQDQLQALQPSPWVLPRIYGVKHESATKTAHSLGAWAIAADRADQAAASLGGAFVQRAMAPPPRAL